MAMSKEKDSMPSDTGDYLFICGICLYNFEKPKALPCLHTFCCECIRQWAEHGSGGRGMKASLVDITCPNCRKKTQLPPGGIYSLPTNFYVSHLKAPKIQHLPACMSCENADVEIQGRCKECGWLCKNCIVGHKTMRALNHHDVLELENLRRGKSGPSKMSETKGKYGTWVRERVFGTFRDASCVAVSPNGDIAVIDKGEVQVLTKEGNLKTTLDTTVSLLPSQTSFPRAIAVDERGYFYVTDWTPYVHVYNEKGKHMFLFLTVLPTDANPFTSYYTSSMSREKSPCCVGIDIFKEVVFVGETSLGYISVHKRDGSHIRSFYLARLGCSPDLITVMDDGIAVATQGDSWVQVFDFSGKSVINIKSPSAKAPLHIKGLCRSLNNDLLLTSYDYVYVEPISPKQKRSQVQRGCICRFCPSGLYQEAITKDVDQDPRGIAATLIDGEEKLLVVSKKHVTVFGWVETT